MNITTTGARAVAALLVLGLGACSGSGSSPVQTTKAVLGTNSLQFAVGTANIQGTIGTNFVTTFRQGVNNTSPGASGSLLSSLTLTGPFTAPAAAGAPDGFHSTIVTGPGPTDAGHGTLTSTSQIGTNDTTFGLSGGAFGLALEPWNSNVNGVPDNVAPYPVPLFDALSGTPAGDPQQFVPWGGPPAFDPDGDGQGTRDGQVFPAGTLGISEGLNVLEMAPVVGPYVLTVTIPTTTSGAPTFTQSAVLQHVGAATPAAGGVLALMATPPTAVPDGAGGLSFTVALPADETEGYVQIKDLGPPTTPGGCHAGADPVYYTIVVHASGTVTLPDHAGPTGEPSICTPALNTAADGAASEGDTFTVRFIGFNYPAFESSYPSSLHVVSPTILGTRGQDDIMISPMATYAVDAGGVITVTAKARDNVSSARRFH